MDDPREVWKAADLAARLGRVFHLKPGEPTPSVRLSRNSISPHPQVPPLTQAHERACQGRFVPGWDEIPRSRSETRLRGFETGCRARSRGPRELEGA
jgi:hypothetical protein